VEGRGQNRRIDVIVLPRISDVAQQPTADASASPAAEKH